MGAHQFVPGQHLLEGDVIQVPDAKDTRIAELERENRQLRRDLKDAEEHGRDELEDATRALAALRRQLQPLYRALQGVFGELDAVDLPDAGPGDAPQARAAGAGDSRVSAVWESWRQKLGAGSAAARMITALEEHGELSVAQMKVAGKMASQTVYDAASKLSKLGLINKNGGKYSLKQL
jgi:hypothetical protein